MKIVIKSGETVENAMAFLQKFLEERKEEFPILKGDMNIYITLKGQDGLVCPENEKEYELTADGVDDRVQRRRIESFCLVMKCWNEYVLQANCIVTDLTKKVQADKKYLASVGEKGRQQVLVDKRKKSLKKHQEKLEQAQQRNIFLKQLNSAVQSETVLLYFFKYRTSSMYYGNEIFCYLIFQDVGGYTGYFNMRDLVKGIPDQSGRITVQKCELLQFVNSVEMD